MTLLGEFDGATSGPMKREWGWTSYRELPKKEAKRISVDYGKKGVLSQGCIGPLALLQPGDWVCVELDPGRKYEWLVVAWHQGRDTFVHRVHRGREDHSSGGLFVIGGSSLCRPLGLRP